MSAKMNMEQTLAPVSLRNSHRILQKSQIDGIFGAEQVPQTHPCACVKAKECKRDYSFAPASLRKETAFIEEKRF